MEWLIARYGIGVVALVIVIFLYLFGKATKFVLKLAVLLGICYFVYVTYADEINAFISRVFSLIG